MSKTITRRTPNSEEIANLVTKSIANRYQFLILFDARYSNPNGDPDAEGRPRVNPNNDIGLVTPECLKHKIRNRVSLMVKEEMSPEDQKRFNIYFSDKAVLNEKHAEAYEKVCPDSESLKEYQKNIATSEQESSEGRKVSKKKRVGNGEEVVLARKFMMEHYYDNRVFGAVMSTQISCGSATGPVQLTLATSMEPVQILEMPITRSSVTTKEESAEQKGDNRTMGRKYVIPYGLYMVKGYVDPVYAEQNGTTDEDLDILWKAIENMFENDVANSRSEMTVRKIFVFKHDNKLGRCPSHKCFDRIRVERITDPKTPASSFSDYEVSVDETKMPAGVELIKYLE